MDAGRASKNLKDPSAKTGGPINIFYDSKVYSSYKS